MTAERIASAIAIACWAGWALYWSASAPRAKAAREQEGQRERASHVLLLGLAFILLAFSPSIPLLDAKFVARGSAVKLIGAAIAVGGTAFAVWARVVIAENWSAQVSIVQDQELIERGPYALVRHPIYTGMLAMFLGTALVQGRLGCLVAVVLAAVSFWIKIGREEALLRRHFPNAYPSYQARVKRLIPFVL